MNLPSATELIERLKATWAVVWHDLRSKRLWPVALVLLLALVAVPVVLSQSSGSSTPPPPPPPPVPQSPVAGLPAVSEVNPSSTLTGRARDPFTQQPTSSSTTSTTGSSTTPATPVSSGSSTAAASGSAVVSTGGSTPSTGGTTSGGSGTTTTPSGGGTPTGGGSPVSGSNGNGSGHHSNPGLGQRQAYAVKLAITTPSGGVKTIDPLERLTPLPSQSTPLLVELGVLKGGNRVLFAVKRGTSVSGPGNCTPGPLDCEILSLGSGQREKLGRHSATGTTPVAAFAVTGIAVVNYSSQAAALRARNRESSAGRRALKSFFLPALSLFRYEPSVGAVVDERNLTVSHSRCAGAC